MKFFLPKQHNFFNLLKELNVFVGKIALLFEEFADSFDNFEDYAKKAKDIEGEADAKAHEIIDCLNKTFITPFDREDIYLLAHELDDIVDLIENVIQNIKIYQIQEKKEAFDEFAKLIVGASKKFDDLMDHFQGQKHTLELANLKIAIHNLEDRGDAIFQKAINELFAEEKDPVAIIKWKDIFENLERIMDKFQEVTNVIEGIIVKSS